MLPLRTPMTVVGEVSSHNGELRIARPPNGKPFFATQLTFNELLSSLGAFSRTCRVMSLTFWLFGCTHPSHNITSFYRPSCANNGKDALNTPERIPPVINMFYRS